MRMSPVVLTAFLAVWVGWALLGDTSNVLQVLGITVLGSLAGAVAMVGALR